MLKSDGGLARNIDFEVANCQVLRKTRRKTSILKLQSGESLARNARFDAPTCLVSSLWFSCGLAVSADEAANLSVLILLEGVKSSCNVVLRGRRGAFALFSEDELHVSSQAQYFGDLRRHFAR